MNYKELCLLSQRYRDALAMERVISGHRLLKTEKIANVLFSVILASFILIFLFLHLPFTERLLLEAHAVLSHWYPLLVGILEITFVFWMLIFLSRAFYFSSYFIDVDPAIKEPFSSNLPEIRYEVALAFSFRSGDALRDFFLSRFGLVIGFRLGLGAEDISRFFSDSSYEKVADILISPVDGKPIGLGDLARSLFDASESLRRFLAKHSVDGRDFIGASGWVSRAEMHYKKLTRFWGRDELGRIPGIGKDWAYGETFLLDKYAVDVSSHQIFFSSEGSSIGLKESEEIERVLSRGRETNVMLVGEDGVLKLSAMAHLARKIISGSVLPPLEHKRVFVFDGAPFVSAMKEKTVFEAEFTRLLNEAQRAGNIIFVFENFHSFFIASQTFGSDLLMLLEPFLDSAGIQIAAISEIGAFHKLFEPNPKIREKFEKIQIAGVGVEAAIPILEDMALVEEQRHGVFFTYQALRAAAESAERYFFEGVMPDKAVDLLFELAPKVKGEKRKIVSRSDVMDLVSRKTGVSAGDAGKEEKDKLINLEQILHQRIVGQIEAVKAIAGALRRARSGVGNPNRPIGSFLFIGPTGVGKTETTKALAKTFFGKEESIVRFDMSEYQTPDALNRLIGASDGGRVGSLASALRDHPFSVLLLDEFEKTNKDVHDLFLQIIDEGAFTDAAGHKVNARNLLIVATSNAGSDLIWNLLKGGTESMIGNVKERVVEEIINRGIFKPELLNRFDGVILFHPLSSEHLRKIARLQLERLAKRLSEKGIELVITDGLVEFLVSVGQDPKFGARPMNRAIQDKVEQVIADRILRGEIKAGSRVELSRVDLEIL